MRVNRERGDGQTADRSAFTLASPQRLGRRACAILHALPAGMAYVDATRKYRFVNQQYEKWLGRRRAGFVGRHVDEIVGFRAEEKARDQLSAALSGEATTVLNEINTPSRARRPVLVQMVPDIDDRGAVGGVLILVNDVADCKNQGVVPANDGAAVESADLLASMTLRAAIHDLRQPLYAMELLVDSLESMVRDDEEKSVVADLKEVLASMAGPLSGLLEVSRQIAASAPGKGSASTSDVRPGHEPSPKRLPYPVAAPFNDEGRASLTALVIDDNASVLKAMQRALEKWGFCVVAAGSVEQALGRLSTLERDPDVVIADYNLPGGLTGIDAIRLVSATRNTKINGLVISGDMSPAVIRRVHAHDCYVLHKPVSAQDFRAVLADICGPLPQ